MTNPLGSRQRITSMRTALLALSAAAVLTLSACGSDMGSENAPEMNSTGGDGGLSMQEFEPSASASASKPAADNSAASTADDVTEYAVAMEQYFFANGYPKDLAGALATAKRLTNLSLSPGNKIATYRFDEMTSEFQLCVENTSGASATYDTEPMSTIETTKTGGCP